MKSNLRLLALFAAVALPAAVAFAADSDAVKPLPHKVKETAKAAEAPKEKAAAKETKDTKDAGSPVVIIKTSLGDMKVALRPDKAPVTVENFLKYVDQKYFDGTIFHRVIPGFMIQGGGFLPDMTEKKGLMAAIKLETPNGLSNKKGTIAMARTGDPNSATSQFFINVNDNLRLDARPEASTPEGYAAFGAIAADDAASLAVAEKIVAVASGNKGPHQNVPVESVVIQSIRRQ